MARAPKASKQLTTRCAIAGGGPAGVILGRDRPVPTWPLRLLDALPPLRCLPAAFVGLGPRPEHISPGLAALFKAAG